MTVVASKATASAAVVGMVRSVVVKGFVGVGSNFAFAYDAFSGWRYVLLVFGDRGPER